MASTPSRLTPQLAAQITADESRLVDLCVVYRRNDREGNPTGEALLTIGGLWDRTANNGAGGFTGQPARRCKVWGVNPSQLQLLDDLAEWLEKRDARDPSRVVVESAAGPRGGGKTDWLFRTAIACNIKFPGSNAWIFSPTLDRREEIEGMIKDWVPISWAQNRLRWPTSVPDCRFTLLNGSSTRSLTADVASNAKRGDRVEFIGLNEAQLMRRRVFSLALPGIRKNGGLLMAAHNPPQADFPAGEWVVDLVEAGDAGKRWLNNRWIDPRLNPSISSATQAMIGEALSDIDSEAHEADIKGDYKRLGDFVYSKFRAADRTLRIEDVATLPAIGSSWQTEDGEGRVISASDSRVIVELPSMVRPTPDIGECTNEVLRKAGWFGRQTVAIGTDHQTYPHQVGVAVKAFKDDKGRVCYWVTDEIIVWGSSVSEAELSHALYSGDGEQGIEYSPDAALLIPDCSGSWQRAARQKGASSIGEMEALGWKCKPPTEIKQTDKSKYPANPPVHRSIALLADVMREGRFFVDPACKWVIESGPKVPYQKDGDRVKISQSKGYAHAWDCIRYAVWFMEPKTRKPATPIRRSDVSALPVARNGFRPL